MNKITKITAGISAFALLAFSSCTYVPADELIDSAKKETTTLELYVQTTAPNLTTAAAIPQTTAAVTTTGVPVSDPTQAPVATTAAQTTPTAPAGGYTTQQVIDLYSNALNLTRAYTGNLVVHHKEDFSANVTEANPGGSLTTQLANTVISKVADPSEADYVFAGGKATNEDGESIPLLLPQCSNFSLPAAGVSSASAQDEGGMTHVKIVLVPETVSMGQIPTYNAGAVGYLDTASLNLKVVKVNSCDINYTGSVIDAVIRPDGYIGSVTYTINMTVHGNVTGLGITGSGTIEGAQTESWVLNWQ